jgi:hypothetical protein
MWSNQRLAAPSKEGKFLGLEQGGDCKLHVRFTNFCLMMKHSHSARMGGRRNGQGQASERRASQVAACDNIFADKHVVGLRRTTGEAQAVGR